jgi:hypothetical protein
VSGLKLLVVDRLNCEIHVGHARCFEHVQVQLVLENLRWSGCRISAKKQVVVVSYGLERGDARQNGLRSPTVTDILLDFEAADAHFEIGFHEGLVYGDGSLPLCNADLLEVDVAPGGRSGWRYSIQVSFEYLPGSSCGGFRPHTETKSGLP